jgi:hypothetical protein
MPAGFRLQAQGDGVVGPDLQRRAFRDQLGLDMRGLHGGRGGRR